MANPSALRPSIGRAMLFSETRHWLPTTSASVTASSGQTRIATSSFSTSAAQSVRKTRDNNRLRGVSTMKRSGPREPLSVSWDPLPRPANYKPKVRVDPKHGLWDFFYGKKLLNTPKEDQAHGRAWTVEELRKKSWDDLHSLWYVCLKERNRIATARRERDRRRLGFGNYEAGERDKTVVTTMKAIKHVLTERFYLWEDARKAAENDPEIDLSGEGEAYTPLDGHRKYETAAAQDQVAEEVEASAEETPIEAEAEAEVEVKPAKAEGPSKKAEKIGATRKTPASSNPVPKL